MSQARQRRCSEAEYLESERRSPVRHEYLRGAVFAMAGASAVHNLIASNVLRALGSAIEHRPCIALGSDQRIHVDATGLYTYPDVSVVCGPPQFHTADPLSITNPVLLVEVLSATTEDYDRGAKFAHYRAIPSLCEVLLVAQDEVRFDHYRRLDTGQWLLTELRSGLVDLPCLGVSLELTAAYAKVELLEGPAAAGG
ncbi:MAG: hypothetical protein AMXMBFR64_62220 [Myxococcales bacterium]